MIICRDTAPAVSAKNIINRKIGTICADFPVLDTSEGCPYDPKMGGRHSETVSLHKKDPDINPSPF